VKTRIAIALLAIAAIAAAAPLNAPSALAPITGQDRAAIVRELRNAAALNEVFADFFIRGVAERAHILGSAQGYREAAAILENYQPAPVAPASAPTPHRGRWWW
jgi:hypothetical protein